MGFCVKMKKLKKTIRGFTLLEAMISVSILIIAVTASLQVYLRFSLLVEENKERTIAVSHQKMAMEEIRSWGLIDDEVIHNYEWSAWLAEMTSNDLLPGEEIIVESTDWVQGFDTSPRRVEVSINWDGIRRRQHMSLIGGFI